MLENQIQILIDYNEKHPNEPEQVRENLMVILRIYAYIQGGEIPKLNIQMSILHSLISPCFTGCACIRPCICRRT